MSKPLSLTKNEQEIMNLLWKEGRPLSRTEIINLSIAPSWKPSSIHILLNQLLEKEAIVVDGFVKTGKNYGRTFSAAFSEEEYHVMQFQRSGCYQQSKGTSFVNFVSTLIQDEDIDNETLTRLENLIEEKRRELK